jgi:hypothetical protein
MSFNSNTMNNVGDVVRINTGIHASKLAVIVKINRFFGGSTCTMCVFDTCDLVGCVLYTDFFKVIRRANELQAARTVEIVRQRYEASLAKCPVWAERFANGHKACFP